MYCWPLWRLIVTSRLVATWCHRLECPPGWSDPLSRVSCAVSLDPGNGSLYPGGHFCPSPVNSRLFTDDYSRLPRIAGSSLNHMIRNCPTTSQETFNDGYNVFPFLAILFSNARMFSCRISFDMGIEFTTNLPPPPPPGLPRLSVVLSAGRNEYLFRYNNITARYSEGSVIPKVRLIRRFVIPKVRYSEGSLFRRSVIPKVR